jgi:ketosteroid isomerase-like protein
MTDNLLEANKQLACRFIEALNDRDIAAMEALLHPEFVWNTAIASDDGPNEVRKLESKLLKGRSLTLQKPRLDRDEALTVLRRMFKGDYEHSMTSLDSDHAQQTAPVDDGAHEMQLKVLALTAEGDRVAMEAESRVVRPDKDRIYNNFYHYLFKIRDGRLTLFKEYQDTLHLFDFTSD